MPAPDLLLSWRPVWGVALLAVLMSVAAQRTNAQTLDPEPRQILEASNIKQMFRQPDGSILQITAEHLQFSDRDQFKLSGAVRFKGRDFELRAEQLDLTSRPDQALTLVARGSPAQVYHSKGMELEADYLEYDSVSRLLSFPQGLQYRGQGTEIGMEQAQFLVDEIGVTQVVPQQ